MSDNEQSDQDGSGVDRMLSRFGPVPQRDPNRRPPGPTPGAEIRRPRPGPRRVAVPEVASNRDAADDRGPLFQVPPDDVFVEAKVPGPTATQVVEIPDWSDTVYADPEWHEPVEVIDRRDWVRVPRRSGQTVRFLLVACCLGLIGSFVYGRVSNWFQDQQNPPGDPGELVEFAIPAGATANDVTQDLYAQGIIANPTLFRYWLSDSFGGEFLAGDYDCLRENMSFDEALDCLDGVGPLPPSFFSITIPEGLRLEEILEVLNRENPAFAEADLENDLRATLVSVGLEGVPDGPLPGSPDPTGSGKEGLLFPATYQIDEKKESDTLDILRRMTQTMEDKFEAAVEDNGRDPVIAELGLTDYQVLIVASLIEEEYRVPGDQPKIARVIYNRLLNGWSLGIDATTCYAAQKSCADIDKADLDSDSLWNTRNLQNRELPPTPIAAPGEGSIRAALNPDDGAWMYYVLTEDDGSHTFAVTDAEFNAAKRICQQKGFC